MLRGMAEIPLYPPREWFTPPATMPKDAGCIVEPNGRIFGYLMHWGAVLMDGSQDRWTPPRSRNAYAFAHTGDTVCEDGETIKTANLGGDAGHAKDAADLSALQDFYENTSTQLARVRYGEDKNGVWFAGACWPTVTELDMAKLRASARSGHWAVLGDWRDMRSGRSGYELVGACLVNVPGLKYARADKAASGVISFNPTAQLASGANHDGAMVALFLDPANAAALAVDGGEPADDLHITLAYFDDEASDRQDWDSIHTLVENVAAKHLPLGGIIGGQGVFATPDGHAHWAHPDVPGIEDLRHDLVHALDLAGFEVRKDHSFTPHITLAYTDPDADAPPVAYGSEVSFDKLTLAVGGDMTQLQTKDKLGKFQRVASGTVELAAEPGAGESVQVGGILVVQNVATEDGRFIESVAWRELPLPLYSSLRNLPGHDSADLVGRITEVSQEGDAFHYKADIFVTNSKGEPIPAGQDTVEAIGNETLRGVSVDGIAGPGDVYWDDENQRDVFKLLTIAGATLTPMPAISEASVSLLSATTEELAVLPKDEDETVEEAVEETLADETEDGDQFAALADQVAAIADRLEFLIGLIQEAQLSARLSAADDKIKSVRSEN